MTKKTSSHYKALEYLSEHPKCLGIDPKNVLIASIEPVLYSKGKFYCKVDLVYESKDKRVVIIEYKSNEKERLIRKGESQLERSVNFYQNVVGVSAEGRLITGNNHLEIKKKRRKNFPNHESKSKNRQ